MQEKWVVRRVSTGEDPIDDGLGEGAGMVSSMAEIRPKVVNQ